MNLSLSTVHGRSSLALHLEVEDLGVAGGGGGDESGVKELEDSVMDTWSSLPRLSSFCPIEEMMRHDARLAPILFLYATERRFRSSTVSSSISTAAETFSMNSAISSYHWACSKSFAIYTFSSLAEGVTAIVFDWWSDLFMWVSDCRIGGFQWLDRWVSDLFTCCWFSLTVADNGESFWNGKTAWNGLKLSMGDDGELPLGRAISIRYLQVLYLVLAVGPLTIVVVAGAGVGISSGVDVAMRFRCGGGATSGRC
nr:hypothetical protein CFP56_67686 [Quercus suber]